MAQARKRKAGDVDAVEIRRIGERHAVITPPRQATLVDMGRVDAAIIKYQKQLEALEQSRAQSQARLDDLIAQRSAFDALAVDREADDPVVPQPEA